MKLIPAAAVLLALAGFLPGQEPSAKTQSRLEELRQDLSLVERLVNQGIELSTETVPLKRAQSFHGVAETLAREIRKSATAGEEKRALQLGDYLQAVLVRGVADNLASARRDAAGHPAKEPEWRSVGERTLQLTQPFAVQSEPATSAEEKILEAAGRVVQPGREALAKVIAGASR